jgi:hypothetical protein
VLCFIAFVIVTLVLSLSAEVGTKNSPTSGSRSVNIVRLQTKSHGVNSDTVFSVRWKPCFIIISTNFMLECVKHCRTISLHILHL